MVRRARAPGKTSADHGKHLRSDAPPDRSDAART